MAEDPIEDKTDYEYRCPKCNGQVEIRSVTDLNLVYKVWQAICPLCGPVSGAPVKRMNTPIDPLDNQDPLTISWHQFCEILSERMKQITVKENSAMIDEASGVLADLFAKWEQWQLFVLSTYLKLED